MKRRRTQAELKGLQVAPGFWPVKAAAISSSGQRWVGYPRTPKRIETQAAAAMQNWLITKDKP